MIIVLGFVFLFDVGSGVVNVIVFMDFGFVFEIGELFLCVLI